MVDTDPDGRSYPDTMARKILGEDAYVGTLWMVIWTALGVIVVGGLFSLLFAMK